MQALYNTLGERKQITYCDRSAVSLDNELVVTGSATKPLFVWRMKDAALAHTVDGQWTTWLYSLAISPDNKLVARGDEIGYTEIRDVTSNSLVASLRHCTRAITAVAFSHDGHFLATVCDLSSKIAVWDLRTKTLLFSIPGATEETCHTVTFSHDNSLVISGWSHGTIHVWNWRLNQEYHLKNPSGCVLRVDCLVGTQYIACQSARQWVEVWDPYSKTCVVTEKARCYDFFADPLNHCTALPSPRFLLYFLLSKGLCLPVSHPWALFLKRGLYDPRLWLQVAAFLWSSDSKSA